MKAFGMEVKKQDVRDIYAEMGKEIKEGLNFNEFLNVMTVRMVIKSIFRDLETQKIKFSKSLSFLMKIISTKLLSKI